MTQQSRECGWCGEVIPANGNVGRPRLYCRRSHRQRAYEARRLAARRQIRPDEVLVPRSTWDRLHGALRDLQEASRAVAMVVAPSAGPDADYVQAVSRLSSAIADLQELSVEPKGRW